MGTTREPSGLALLGAGLQGGIEALQKVHGLNIFTHSWFYLAARMGGFFVC